MDPGQDPAAMLQKIRQQAQMQQVTEIMQKISERCFEMCVPRPGSRLSNSEQSCLSSCMDRYYETMGLVTQAVAKKSGR